MCWPTFDVMRFSAASTTPSTARTPIAAPALEIASMAYSTWYNRPSGLKIVVLESYLRAIFTPVKVFQVMIKLYLHESDNAGLTRLQSLY